MLTEQPLSSVSAHRRKLAKAVDDDLNSRSPSVDRYFGVVTLLAAFGTVVAAALVIITSSTISDAIWLFNQVP